MGYSTTIGYRNNNYFNIKYVESNAWKGQVKQNSPYVFDKFEKPVYGVRAFFLILSSYKKRGVDTIEKIVNTYAPPVENNTKNYLNFVLGFTGLKANSTLNFDDQNEMANVAKAFCKMEIGYDLPDDLAKEGYLLAFPSPLKKKDNSTSINPVFVVILVALILVGFKTLF